MDIPEPGDGAQWRYAGQGHVREPRTDPETSGRSGPVDDFTPMPLDPAAGGRVER